MKPLASTAIQHRRNIDIAIRTIEAIKLASGCVDCGFKSHPAALHFDHVDPRTKREVDGWVKDRSKLTTRSRLERYLRHIDACCEIRCANCHAVRTTREKHWLPASPTAGSKQASLF